jgi:hypothetical protein
MQFNEEDKTEIGITGLPIPARKMSAAKRHEFEKKRRENLKKRPGETGDSRLTQALRQRAKSTGNYAEGISFSQFMCIVEQRFY